MLTSQRSTSNSRSASCMRGPALSKKQISYREPGGKMERGKTLRTVSQANAQIGLKGPIRRRLKVLFWVLCIGGVLYVVGSAFLEVRFSYPGYFDFYLH